MMFCFRVRKLMAPYSEGALDRKRSEAVANHISGCSRCAAELALVRNAAQAIKSFRPTAQEPSADLWAKVEREIASPAPARSSWRPRGLQLAGAAAVAAVLLFAVVDLRNVSEVAVKPIEQRESLPRVAGELHDTAPVPSAKKQPRVAGNAPAGQPAKKMAAAPEASDLIPSAPASEPKAAGTRSVDSVAPPPSVVYFSQARPEAPELTAPSVAEPAADRAVTAAAEKAEEGFRGNEALKSSPQAGIPGPAGPHKDDRNKRYGGMVAASVVPSMAEVSRDTGAVLAARGDKEGALKAWRAGLEANPEDDAGILAAAERASLLDDLASSYEKDAKDKKSADASPILARIHERRKEYAKAIEIRRNLSQREPQNAKNWLSLGDDLVLTGDFAGANDAFANALKTGDPKVQDMARQRQNSPLNRQTPLNQQLRKRG